MYQILALPVANHVEVSDACDYSRRDSNSQSLRSQILSLMRMPIPPLEHMEERAGFEPAERCCRSTAFEAVAIIHSATFPWRGMQDSNLRHLDS